MVRKVRRFLAGAVVVVGLGALAACSGGSFLADREPWRKEAEARCVGSGAVREGPGVVRINAINGPGRCGADYPFKVTTLGEPGALGFGDDLRPPASIPNGAPPRWPIAEPRDPSPEPRYNSRPAPRSQVDSRPLPAPTVGPDPRVGEPVSLDPPTRQSGGAPLDVYDFRRPYGTSQKSAPPARTPARPPARGEPLDPAALDMSPEPYESRRTFEDTKRPSRREPRFEEPPPEARAPVREPRRAAPLGPSRGPRVAGATGTISFNPPATLACPLVAVLDQWIASSVQPAAMRWFGEPVVEIRQISAYSCRGMNGNPNSRISEHAFGNALDIAAFTFASGRRVTVRDGWRGAPEEQGFLRDVQGAACDRFTTVLAPGSNRFHYDHFHFDLMRRRGTTCNPRAVSGEEVAARARTQYARQGRDPGVTGSIEPRRKGAPAKALRPNAFTEDKVGHQLPLAVPGEDGED